MRNLKRLTALMTLALVAMAFTAASASADIVDPISGDPYVGEVAGVNTGADPTLVTSTTTITCADATIGGTIDGNAPATAELDFAWNTCNIVGGVKCTFSGMNDVSVDIDEALLDAPNATIVNSELGSTFMSCATGTINCTISSDPDDGSGLTDYPGGTGSEVTFDVVGGSDPVAYIQDDLSVSGLNCPSVMTWNAQYEITEPVDGLESND
jgi:hypothetical protein